jgi:hypothetical protein
MRYLLGTKQLDLELAHHSISSMNIVCISNLILLNFINAVAPWHMAHITAKAPTGVIKRPAMCKTTYSQLQTAHVEKAGVQCYAGRGITLLSVPS